MATVSPSAGARSTGHRLLEALAHVADHLSGEIGGGTVTEIATTQRRFARL